MKGIILAGGSGSRLYPLTKTISKQLLPVYDKPMIYYPLSTLMLLGVTDILIISTPKDTPNIETLFSNGNKYGLNIEYKIQEEPKGIAEAFEIGKDFIASDDVCLILGDNIFYMGTQIYELKKQAQNNKGALLIGYNVPDPERFGIAEFKNNKVFSLEEKPLNPKSSCAVVGLYFYSNDVVKKVKTLKPSSRGELEITDLNKIYLNEDRLSIFELKRGSAWIDAGTPESLFDANQYIQILERRQGLKISCIEEIALRSNFINLSKFKDLIDEYPKGDYKKYLTKLYEEFKNV